MIKLIEKEKKKPERKKRLSLNLGMYTIKDITFLLVNNSINNSYYWNCLFITIFILGVELRLTYVMKLDHC